MSLNKFTNVDKGYGLQLDLGADEIKANQIETTNIDLTTINGAPYMPGGGGVTNPLSANLALGGFSIIEPLAAVSPSLNIDQLDPAKVIDLKVAGVPKVVVKNGEVDIKENLKMNQKQIDDVLVVNNSAGPLNLIGGSGVSAVLIDATPTQGIIVGTDVGKSTEITGDTEISLISNTGNIELNPASQMNVNAGGLPRLTVDASEVGVGANLNLNGNKIDNVTELNSGLSNAILNLVGRDRVDIGIAGGGRMEIEDTRVFISQFADLNIHDKVVWVQPNIMPPTFDTDKTYIFVGSRTTASSFTLPQNCKICGTGKNNSFINYTGAGVLFTTTDNNLSMCDITLTSSDNAGRILDANNLGQDRTINMTRVQLRNCKNGMAINGYDLVDLNNCLFTYFESGSASPIGIRFSNSSKVQLSSCEFLRWFQEGGTPATTFFNGNMLQFNGLLNALIINGCFFHPQYDQNGIDLSGVTSVLEGTITSNTFIDINLNSPTFQVLVLNPTIAPSYVVEGNSIYPNLRAQLTYVLSGVNAANTVLSGGSNPNAVNTGGLAIALTSQFSSLTAAGLATYLKKRSANFLITASANLRVIAGGASQRVGLGLRVNGVDVPNAYSFVTLDSAGTAPKQATLNFTGVASQNDTFELTVFNASGNNDVLVSDVNFAGIEI